MNRQFLEDEYANVKEININVLNLTGNQCELK